MDKQQEEMAWVSPLPPKPFVCTAVRYAPKTSGLRASKLLSSCLSYPTRLLTEMSSQSPNIAPRYKTLSSIALNLSPVHFACRCIGFPYKSLHVTRRFKQQSVVALRTIDATGAS